MTRADATWLFASRTLLPPVLLLLLALLVCDASAADPVADTVPIIVGVAALFVALAGLTLFETVVDWPGVLTAFPLALPTIHLETSSLCSRK